MQDFSRRQAVELWQTDGMGLRCREAGFAVLVHKLRMLNVAWIRVRGSPHRRKSPGQVLSCTLIEYGALADEVKFRV